MSSARPQANPPSGDYTDSSDSVIYVSDEPGDTTPAPRPPNVPRGWPGREAPPDKQPPVPPGGPSQAK